MSERLTDEDLMRLEGMLKEAPIRSFVLLLEEVRASRAEIAGLKADLAMASGTIHAQDERERRAGERCEITYERHGCDWPDAMADEVLRLRAERDALDALVSRLEPG